jgi:hypothetical protein
VNWLQVNHSLVSNRAANWNDHTAGKSLVYNTQTGKTRAVNLTDRVVSTLSECACYVMQHLNIAGQRVLALYDSEADSNIVEFHLARDAGFHQIGFKAVSFNVTGGGSVRSSCGQFSAILGPDVNGNIHDVECQAVDQITSTFPKFRLDDIITEAKATIGGHQVFPQEIGGAPVKLLMGIRSTQLVPVLPSGLCVYESKFRDVYGATLCFGGPHEVFTRGYKQAGFCVATGMLQVLFAESASAYMGGIRVVVGASIEEEEAADSFPSAPPVVVTPQPMLASNAAIEEFTSRPGPPVSFEPSKDSAEPDGALPTEPDRSCSVDSHMTMKVATGELHELAGEAVQPDPPPSAPESTVESDVLDTTVATTDQMTSTTALDLDVGAHEADSTDTGAVADAADVGQFELGDNAEEPDPSPSTPEPSTVLNDQKITPVEEVAQGFIAVTLIAADKSPDPQMERLRTPRTSGDKNLASWHDVCTKCSTHCDYEDAPSSPPVKEVPGIRSSVKQLSCGTRRGTACSAKPSARLPTRQRSSRMPLRCPSGPATPKESSQEKSEVILPPLS